MLLVWMLIVAERFPPMTNWTDFLVNSHFLMVL